MQISTAVFFLCSAGALGCIVYLILRLRRERAESIQKTEERRSSFVSIISHQLRTPLSVIKGYLEALSAGDLGPLNDSQGEYVNDALKMNRETIELVNDYLHIVKLDAQKLDLKREMIDFTALIEQEVKRLQSIARASNCELVFQAPTGSRPFISADRVKLKQVVENILTNAIKYSSGRGRAEIALTDRDTDVLFACKDNGVGIPADEQEAIFTKFFRAKNILHKDTVGSGLGLFIARVIVEAHGGSIWFESTEGKGTTFFFTIAKNSPDTP
ncbi:MAG: ATP-binding protein [Patescibacteria group bacterium]|nr:ATP-binding protein [Patescibacteria group bacterium]MDD5715630.1 ATP-binding protein [Patescibacteria group bacterium]